MSASNSDNVDDRTSPHDAPIRRADQHTRAMMGVVREQHAAWEPVGPTAVGLPSSQGPVEMIDVIPSVISAPAVDEDISATQVAKRVTTAALSHLPIVDDPTPWQSDDHWRAFITSNFEAMLPPRLVEWADPGSDRTIELLAMQGLAAHRLEPAGPNAHGASFVVDLTWMGAYEVRENYLRYGACAYFSAAGQVLCIHCSHDDEVHRPSDATWEHAKWTWRSTLFAAVTVADHLGSMHYLSSNLLVTVLREALPTAHPLRRLLKAFTYGTADINRDAARALSNKGGVAHRLFAFTYEGLTRCLRRGVEAQAYASFPDRIGAMNAGSLGDRHLFAHDGARLHAVFERYVRDYLDVYFDDDTLVADQHVRAFWQSLIERAPNLGLHPLSSAQQLQDLLTDFMFTVTGMHAQVGAVIDYLADPRLMAGKIRADLTAGDVQSTIQVLNLAILTGFEQPPLLGDYRHILLDDEAKAVFDRYQASLRELSQTIDALNLEREQPFQTFNPAVLDVSVST